MKSLLCLIKNSVFECVGVRLWVLSLGLNKSRIGEISILLVKASKNRKQTNKNHK